MPHLTYSSYILIDKKIFIKGGLIIKKENKKQIKENELENVVGGKRGPVDEIIHPSDPKAYEEDENISSPLGTAKKRRPIEP